MPDPHGYAIFLWAGFGLVGSSLGGGFGGSRLSEARARKGPRGLRHPE